MFLGDAAVGSGQFVTLMIIASDYKFSLLILLREFAFGN